MTTATGKVWAKVDAAHPASTRNIHERIREYPRSVVEWTGRSGPGPSVNASAHWNIGKRQIGCNTSMDHELSMHHTPIPSTLSRRSTMKRTLIALLAIMLLFHSLLAQMAGTTIVADAGAEERS